MNVPNNGIWLGLLKWSLAYTDGTSASDATKMTDENKLFLEKVMKECIKDEPARLNEIIRVFMKFLAMDISDTPSTSTIPSTNPYKINQEIVSTVVSAKDEIDSYLYEIEDIVDQIDMAQIFVKFGGLECLVRFLEIDELGVSLRGHIAVVIGELSQNNIKVQDDIFNKNDFLSRLLDVYLTPCSSTCETVYDSEQLAKLRTKILYAISCSVRSHPAAEISFALNNASKVFHIAFESTHVALIQKTLYLASALLSSEFVLMSSSYCIMNIIQAVIPACFSYLEFDELELRESVCICLRSVLRSRIGWTYLNEVSHAADKTALENLLSVRTDSVKKSLKAPVQASAADADSQSAEEFEKNCLTHELELLLEVTHMLLSPTFPDSGSSGTATAMNSLMVV